MKMGAKTKTKKDVSSQAYYRSLPLYEWWEEFSGEYADNGTLKYQTVWQFVKKKAKTENQKQILWWLLGPKATDGNPKFADIPQLDWMEKRTRGFWHGTKQLEDMKKSINVQMSSLEAIREAGKVNVDVIGNMRLMLEQLDREMGGQLFLPNLDAKQNEQRIEFMIRLKERIVGLLTQAQTMYAKSQGIDFANLEAVIAQFGQLMVPQYLGKTIEGSMHRADNDTAAALTKMLMAKSVEYSEEGIALPDKDMETVVRQVAKKGNTKLN